MTKHPPIAPRCDDLGYSLRRYFVDTFYLREVSRFSAGATVLDLGGTSVDRRGQFDIARFDLKVVCANCSTDKSPDVQCRAEELPFADGSFQAVICAELLEHVRSPEKVLDEVRRVLQPGGTLLVTAPFLVGVHADPSDYGRYTEEFWRALLTEKGFSIDGLERQGAFWSVICDLFRVFCLSRSKGRGVVQRGVTCFLEYALRLGRKRALRHESAAGKGRLFTDFTTGYGVVAQRL